MGFRFLMKFIPIIREHFISRSLTQPSSPLWSFRIVKKSYPALNSELYDHPDFKIHRRWHMGHAHHHGDDRSGKEGEKIIRLGLAADIGLTAGKALTGYISGSTAIIADAAHSLSDVVLSGVALLSFKAARVPKDKEHPYGHGKFETLGALGISGVLIATSGGIAFHAFYILWDILTAAAPSIVDQSIISHSHVHGHEHGGHHPDIDMEHPVLALNVIVISIAIKEGLYWITKRAGEKTGSGLMKANAWHHRADAVSSLVALIGVGGSILGVRFLDPLAGLVVSGMIFRAGLVSGYQSVMELVDAAVPSHCLEPYKRTIMEIEGVKGFSSLRGRRAGSSLYLDVDILVDPFTSVSAAHDIGENVRHRLQQSHTEVTEVFIHIEPAASHIHQSCSDHQSCIAATSEETTDIEDNVANILSLNFSMKMTVERITRHSLKGRIYLEVYVSMPSDVLVRDAVKNAEEAEEMILETVPNVSHVSIHLRLGRPIPE